MRNKIELSFGGQDDVELNETQNGIGRKKVSLLNITRYFLLKEN